MELRRIETPGIAHYAYLIGDAGKAAVVDPRRDVDEYVWLAHSLGLQIEYVIETHRQEDFVMGAAHLAEWTGACIVNGDHDQFGHGDIRLSDGDTFDLGGLRFRALHTPGHTPESMSYAVYAPEAGEQAWGVFTGDALFFGDTGRTDLADADRARENAELLYDMVHAKIAPLGEATLVLPAHGPGSVCGSGMAPRPISTVGAERHYNQVFMLDRAAFADRKASERIPRPPYFEHMEEVNLGGGLPPLRMPDSVPRLAPEDFIDRGERGKIIDTRKPEAFAGGHVPGAYAVWMGGLPIFGGWVASHETSVYLVTNDDAEIAEAVRHLSRIGVDRVTGALAGGFDAWRGSAQPIETLGVTTPHRLAEQRGAVAVVDVRDEDEYAGGHVAGARHLYVGHLDDGVLDLDLNQSAPVAVTCSIGNRSGLGASILKRHGFRDVRNVLGGMTAWERMGLPIER
ncbi:MAG: MBL fold metallo-hydrolase [Myxococcota bacterium]